MVYGMCGGSKESPFCKKTQTLVLCWKMVMIDGRLWSNSPVLEVGKKTLITSMDFEAYATHSHPIQIQVQINQHDPLTKNQCCERRVLNNLFQDVPVVIL